jgi:hypothetical protein
MYWSIKLISAKGMTLLWTAPTEGLFRRGISFWSQSFSRITSLSINATIGEVVCLSPVFLAHARPCFEHLTTLNPRACARLTVWSVELLSTTSTFKFKPSVSSSLMDCRHEVMVRSELKAGIMMSTGLFFLNDLVLEQIIDKGVYIAI